jgi:uncharacterized surface protein with fasciclin (FAS1) repeats
MSKRSTLRLLWATSVLALAACASMSPPPASIADTVARTPELSTLNRLLNEAGLADTLRGPGPFTVFAPNDEAFKAIPAADLAKLAADKDALRSVLTFHVVPGKLTSADIKNGPVKTVQGDSLALSKAGTFVTVEDAVVLSADLATTNGTLHVIDRVLMPPKK